MPSKFAIGLAGFILAVGAAAGAPAEGLVQSVTSAPVVPDGDVAGRVTDLVINFDRSPDPAVPGRTLLEGKTIKITLADAFVNGGKLPVRPALTEGCKPPDWSCNTAVLLQGWPQRPIRPPKDKYELSFEGTHTLVVTALQDLGPVPEEPGIKQVHLLFFGFTNPPAGQYPIEVAAETGPDGALEMGRAMVDIRPATSPRITVTNLLFEPPGLNAIYQQAKPGGQTPRPYDFLIWDAAGAPLEGVTIEGGKLLKDGQTVGEVTIAAPAGASGQMAVTEGPSVAIKAPVSTRPAGHLRAFFQAGSAPGEYTASFALAGGNTQQMVVRVE